MTASSEPKSTYGIDLHLLEEVGVRLADARHAPDLDSLRIHGGELAGAPARRDDLVTEPDDVPLADAVEDERLARSARVAHDPLGAGSDVDRRRRRLLVGEELDARRVRGHARHEPDEPVRSHDGVEHPNSVVRARGDDDRLCEGEPRAGR